MSKRITQTEAYLQALKYFGLGKHDPFGAQITREVVEDTEDARAIISGIEYAAHNDALFAVVGPAGSGKTAMSRAVMPRLKAAGITVVRICPLISRNLTLRAIATAIVREINNDESYRPPHSNEAAGRELMEEIYKYCLRENRHVLLMIDEAQGLRNDVIRALKRIWNEGYANYTLSIVLLGQSRLDNKLAAVNEFRDRCTDVYHCRGLLPDEIASVIDSRIHARAEIISTDAIERLASLVPRIYPTQLLQYMRAVLANGYRRGDDVITADTIDATPRGVLYNSLLEIYGISQRAVARASGRSIRIVAQVLGGATSSGYQPSQVNVDEVHDALNGLIDGGTEPIPDNMPVGVKR